MSALMAQGCVGQDFRLGETAVGFVLELHWPVCLSLKCGGQRARLATCAAQVVPSDRLPWWKMPHFLFLQGEPSSPWDRQHQTCSGKTWKSFLAPGAHSGNGH